MIRARALFRLGLPTALVALAGALAVATLRWAQAPRAGEVFAVAQAGLLAALYAEARSRRLALAVRAPRLFLRGGTPACLEAMPAAARAEWLLAARGLGAPPAHTVVELAVRAGELSLRARRLAALHRGAPSGDAALRAHLAGLTGRCEREVAAIEDALGTLAARLAAARERTGSEAFERAEAARSLAQLDASSAALLELAREGAP